MFKLLPKKRKKHFWNVLRNLSFLILSDEKSFVQWDNRTNVYFVMSKPRFIWEVGREVGGCVIVLVLVPSWQGMKTINTSEKILKGLESYSTYNPLKESYSTYNPQILTESYSA